MILIEMIGVSRLYCHVKSLPSKKTSANLFKRRTNLALFSASTTPPATLNNSSTFVSKHFSVDQNELRATVGNNFGGAKNIRANHVSGDFEVKTCFDDCSKERKMESDNVWKLIVRKDGSYYCHRCGMGGNWYQLKRRLSGDRSVDIIGLGGVSTASYNTSNISTFKNSSKKTTMQGGSGNDEAELNDRENETASNLQLQEQQPPHSITVLIDQQEAFSYHLNLMAGLEAEAAGDSDAEDIGRRTIESFSLENGSIVASYVDPAEAQRKTGIRSGSISSVCNGKGKSAGGLGWRFAQNQPTPSASDIPQSLADAKDSSDSASGSTTNIDAEKGGAKGSVTPSKKNKLFATKQARMEVLRYLKKVRGLDEEVIMRWVKQ